MKKTLRMRTAFLISIVSLPTIAFAGPTEGLNSLKGLVDTFTSGVVSSLAALFATMAMVAFFWGIVQFIWGSREGKPDEMTKGKNFMLWGLIALFVLFSVWGIITYFQTIFGIQGQNTINIPRIQINGSATTNNNTSTTGLPVGSSCSSNAQCASGLTCNNFTCQSTGAVQGAQCTSNAECGSGGLTCKQFTCQP